MDKREKHFDKLAFSVKQYQVAKSAKTLVYLDFIVTSFDVFTIMRGSADMT